MDLLKEYRMLRRLAADYNIMSASQQRAFDQRLGAWMLAADITTDASVDMDAIKMRECLCRDQKQPSAAD